ncbi:hypothetical protein Pint_14494 [Pistacia integerrima]|uniref:Uncharacterized protein n=1 Tax=Pistacia integerrima TaxID=434235 RepID=A0ACC0YAF6_9ROSI|nr:hypothetical protein Pint_14494 [Pistacia integerrima]
MFIENITHGKTNHLQTKKIFGIQEKKNTFNVKFGLINAKIKHCVKLFFDVQKIKFGNYNYL